MSNIKLSIILPSLRPEKLKELLWSIETYTFIKYELIFIIDSLQNFSFLENITLEPYLKNVTILFDDKKTGTVYPIGLGLEKSQGEYIVTLSDDCLVTPCWADEMYDFMKSQDQSIPLLGNFRVYDTKNEYGPIGYYGKIFSMFPFIKKTDIDKIGGYYLLDFNAHYADPDLGMRVWNMGGKVISCPHAWIFHIWNGDKLHQDNYNKYFKKDEEVFTNKWSNGNPIVCEHFPKVREDEPPFLWR